MFHDPRLSDTLAASRPVAAPVEWLPPQIVPARAAIAPVTMLSLVALSAGLWGAIAYAAHLI